MIPTTLLAFRELHGHVFCPLVLQWGKLRPRGVLWVNGAAGLALRSAPAGELGTPHCAGR